MQVWVLPRVQRVRRIYWGGCSSTGTLWAAAHSELGLACSLLRCTQTKMGTIFTHFKRSWRANVCPYNILSLPNIGIHWCYSCHWDRCSHHGFLVSHQSHCASAHGALRVLAGLCHLSQLLHLERQPWERGQVTTILCHNHWLKMYLITCLVEIMFE